MSEQYILKNQPTSLETVQQLLAEVKPAKISLTRYQKGGYGWEISLRSETLCEAFKEIVETDEKMRDKFAREEEG